MKDTRIQKALSELGVCSRRAAEELIRQGRVKLNGHPVQVGDKMDMERDLISVDGKTIRPPKKKEYIYEMLHKPRGYLTTMSDERGRKTVMELVSYIPGRVFPVGRLDRDSEGLLLFTNDGSFANLLTHPSHGVSKLYRVTVRPRASEEQIAQLAAGVVLDDGEKTQPAGVRVLVDEPERTVLEMSIHEGKNRQIRRMCEAVGLTVIRLKRNAEGPVKLGMLQPGQHRPLTKQEVNALRASAAKAVRREQTETAQRRAEQARSAKRGPLAPRRRRTER